jgi:hypothetical protein
MFISNDKCVKKFDKLIINVCPEKKNFAIQIKDVEIKLRNIEIQTNNLEIRMSEYPLIFIKKGMVNVALGILYQNNNIDNILSSKNDVIRLGNFSMTKNEFKVKYSKMCNGITFVSPSVTLVNRMIITVRNTDFSTVDPRSVILFAKEIIENYEDIMKKDDIL